mmetsp:Transcript_26154/g.72134  ORF Transcript_26154/g.72134 Transcript_26154/m.72134 type:complete len:970 (+) Transcript_26154:232-3141(+)|eukprot:CAMPEP_0168761610 /NCGR_PEP_ID=MMETSP0724-20121128/23411_1 /TAXON_ID=265536 /ORGANISM="Amphiprora sp., Strain CCMP467" /LENGTH=969 /DNA_ID=CAMNT_0008810737 /DNA_START=177 /DNA_END=3086 /DNA_ORIENTATION=+
MSHPSASARKSRPATITTTSVSEIMRSKQAQALDLEQQYEQLVKSKGHEEEADSLRGPLCSLFADMIMEDPKASCEMMVDSRLWNKCFYSRIHQLRSAIAKERRGKNAAAVQENQRGMEKAVREALALYNYLCQTLQGTMTGNLSQTQYSQQSEEEEDSYIRGDNTQLGESQQQGPKAKEGIVQMVHYLYIRIGDLHRYRRLFSQAQASYENAIALGPGHGTPYNQLAVVDQSKENPQNVISLYWYARAVLATHDPSEISFRNAERLLDENHEAMMKNHGRDELSSTQQQQLQLHDSRPKPIQTKQFLGEFVDLHRIFLMAHKDGTQKEEKPEKSKKNKRGGSSLAKSLASSQRQHPPHQQQNISDVVEQVMERFQTLLGASAFSDALLLKMICIHAFSETHIGGVEQQHQQDEANSQRRKVRSRRLAARTATWLMARTCTYTLASCIAKKILNSWNATRKQHEKQSRKSNNKKSKSAPSTRLLVPLLLLSEYFFWSPDRSEDQNDISDDSEERVRQKENLDSARKEFWKTSFLVWELAMQQFGVTLGENDDAKPLPMPDAFNQLVGYGPFAQFIRLEPGRSGNSMDTDDGYATAPGVRKCNDKGFMFDDEAVIIFNGPGFQSMTQPSQMSQQGSTQQSQSQTAQGENNSARNNPQLVVRRLLSVAQRIAKSTEPEWMRHLLYIPDGQFLEWKDDLSEEAGSAMDVGNDVGKEKEEEYGGGGDDDGDNYMPPDDDDDDDAGDNVLVYQEGLLVPGAMVPPPSVAVAAAPTAPVAPVRAAVAAMDIDSTARQDQKNQEDGEDVDMGHILSTEHKPDASQKLSAPPGFGGPPPGFGGGAASTLPPPSIGIASSSGLFSQQQPVSSIYAPTPGGGPTIGSVFASIPSAPTQNPFFNQAQSLPAADSMSSHSALNSGPSALSFLQPQSGNQEEGASLLDSGLLQSLWMDDANKAQPVNGSNPPITKNPFYQAI